MKKILLAAIPLALLLAGCSFLAPTKGETDLAIIQTVYDSLDYRSTLEAEQRDKDRQAASTATQQAPQGGGEIPCESICKDGCNQDCIDQCPDYLACETQDPQLFDIPAPQTTSTITVGNGSPVIQGSPGATITVNNGKKESALDRAKAKRISRSRPRVNSFADNLNKIVEPWVSPVESLIRWGFGSSVLKASIKQQRNYNIADNGSDMGSNGHLQDSGNPISNTETTTGAEQ